VGFGYPFYPGYYGGAYYGNGGYYAGSSGTSYYYSPSSDYPYTPPGGAGAAPVTNGQKVNADIADTQFQPGQLVIGVGTTVYWTNRGTNPHTVTSAQGLWDSGNIPAGYTYNATFNQPGIYTYYDKSNPNVRGEIIVR
jgi:plastocyanin